MKLIKKTKGTVGKFFLKKDALTVNRKVKVCNIHDARSIGILYDATSGGEDFEKVKKFGLKLIEAKKDVALHVYYDLKTVPNILSEKIRYDFFTKKDLTRYLKPNDQLTERFMKREFDILINLTIGDCFPLIYATSLSHAKFKVGFNKEKNRNYFDFLIGGEDNSVAAFIKDVEHYLTIINS